MSVVTPQVGDQNVAAAATRKRWTYHRVSRMWGYIFIAPFMLFFIIFTLVPYIGAVALSLVNWQPLGTTRWVGLDNYKFILAQESFQKAIFNSFYYTVMVVPASILISLITAILLISLSKNWQSFFQAAFYLPGVISGLAIAVIWRFVFDYEVGVLNYIVTQLGLPRTAWLGNVKTAMPSLAFMALIGGHGSTIIIFSAALLGIPQDLYDAASVDGAGFWHRHWAITLPLLVPSLLYVMVMGTLGALQVFVPIYVLTRGGPVFATMTVGYYIYNELVFFGRSGTASAGGLVLLVLTTGLTIVQFRRFSQVVEV